MFCSRVMFKPALNCHESRSRRALRYVSRRSCKAGGRDSVCSLSNWSAAASFCLSSNKAVASCQRTAEASGCSAIKRR